ncbi:translation initiation factor IF-2 [bacterium]|nr:translation initiation factor IF-2 [bacterium]
MAPINEQMFQLVSKNFTREETEAEKQSDFRKKLEEKRNVEEARREAVRHEIDELLEMSRREVFEPVKTLEITHPKPHKKPQKPMEKDTALSVDTVAQEKVEAVVVGTKEEVVRTGNVKSGKEKHIRHEHKEVPKSTSGKKEHSRAQSRDTADAPGKSHEKSTTSDKSDNKPKRQLKRRPSSESPEKSEKEDGSGSKHRRKNKSGKRDDVKEKQSSDTDSANKKKRRRKKKRRPAVVIDEKEIQASIKSTLAKMDDSGTKRKKRKKERTEESDAEIEVMSIRTTEFASVHELANIMDVEASDVIKACFSLGLMVSINQRLDRDTIIMVADEFDYEVDFQTEYGEEKAEEIPEEEDDITKMVDRAPVVTIMGHVDHGKTSLLDFIRKSNVISGESGGITQHIGAYEVENNGKRIAFLDTPGHEAFTAMRARGAQVTDIVILVVAADDNVMPQTIEAINHAKAAGVPMIVAINKMDLPNANSDLIKKKLADFDVLVEEWGGKVQAAEISAKTGMGVEHILELILLEAELLELKADPGALPRGVVIEAMMDKGRGVVGTILIKKGTLHIGDSFIAGQFNGRVRAMFDESGKKMDSAPPSTPVQVLGFNGMPQAGDVMAVLGSEQEAREIGLKRQQLKREQSFRQHRLLTLDQIGKQIAEGQVRELSIIIKGDVDGSTEALADSLMQLSTDDVAVRIIHKGVGDISESDVDLATASQAIILGFHVHPNVQARELANKEKVEIRLYKIIYDVVEDVRLALEGMLEPDIIEKAMGTVEVRAVFRASKVGLIAGCYVTDGKIVRNANVRVRRDGESIFEGKLSSLKRFQDDTKEVASGYECGLTVDGFKDVKEGDIIEAYTLEEEARTL